MLQTLASNVRRRILPSAKHHPSDVGQACAIRVMHPDWLLHCPSRVFYDLPHFTYEIVFFAHDHHMSVLRVGSNIQTAKYNVANRQYSFPFSSSPSDRQRHRADLEQFLCFFPHLLVLLPLEQFLCFFLSGDMSTSSSAPRSTWPVYGPVPMTRCTDCPRTAPLKRLTSKEEKNGNFGREFVKCESKPEGQVRSEFSSHPLSLISQKICQIWI